MRPAFILKFIRCWPFYILSKNTDFVVLETGLGGRLDATNAADSLVCGITPLSFEHVQKLGNTEFGLPRRRRELLSIMVAIVIIGFTN